MTDFETKAELKEIFERVGNLIESLQLKDPSLYIASEEEIPNTQTEYQTKVLDLLNKVWDEINKSGLASNESLLDFFFFMMRMGKDKKNIFTTTVLNDVLGGDYAQYQRLNTAINRYVENSNYEFPHDLRVLIEEKIIKPFMF